jgi:hypothetical protein
MNYASARSQVALEALAVAPETTFTTMCPVCHGGQSGEKKLSVTRVHNGALYICMRASCPGFRGFVAIGEQGSRDMQRRPSQARPFRQATEWDDEKSYKFWQTYAGLKNSSAHDIRRWGVRWTHDAIVYECRGFNDELRGHVTRTPGKIVKTYRAREGLEMYAVYTPAATSHGTVLVEDCVSAMSVAANGFMGIALLGTNVPESVDKWVRFPLDRPPLIWLDPDAELKAMQIANSIPGARAVIGYQRDPKDLENLWEILQKYV